jgi:uncharacterized Zn-finger protein
VNDTANNDGVQPPTAGGDATPNDKNLYQIDSSALPLHCPMPEMSLWNSHPRVFLPIEETGQAKCPYCGAEFVLSDPT